MSSRLRASARLGSAAALVLVVPVALGQTIPAPFDEVYTYTDLGSVPGLPANYGGLTVKPTDFDTLLIGGAANSAAGIVYSIGIVRDGKGHIVGFDGTAAPFVEAAYNDGGVVYGPGGVLFLARWPANELGQAKPGSAITDKIIDVAPFGVASSLSAINFVPPGFDQAGHMKLVSWSIGTWYDATIAPDGAGTFDIVSLTPVPSSNLGGGPEGFIYVPTGSPLFDVPSMLVSEYSAGNVAAYEVDANGDPIVATRQNFVTGLSGAEGATIDPVTGDFLFSTFGGGSRVIVVTGFATPPPPCIADLDGNGVVNGADLGLLLGNWGGAGLGDLNDSGSVDGADLGILLAAWGPCPR
ncbi:MAG: hypothetical protein KDA22_02955 [Phycisphaerales bacterium]|nr:hypothetical protein [Phycisphaerales bacterium]